MTASKVVGVLGGMGPEATVHFMARVIALTPAQLDQDHIRMLVDHNPRLPNRQEAILGDAEDPGPALAAMAFRLEAAGADFLVIPCNTAHAFEQHIVEVIGIPLVSIITETIAAIPDDCGAVGLLATEGCLRAGMYQRAVEARGRRAIEPTARQIQQLMQAVAAIKAGNTGPEIAELMHSLACDLVERGAQVVIEGCTEISIVLDPTQLDVPLLSSTDILAQRTVQLALTE